MDVYTFSQPENNLLLYRNSLEARQKKTLVETKNNSYNYELFSKIAMFVLAFYVCFIVIIQAPNRLKHRFGWYRINSLSFSSDSLAETSLRKIVFPEVLKEDIVSIPVETPFALSYSKYTVKPGDSISSIVSRVGLRNMSTLLSVNNISNARRLRSGEQITIPSMDGVMHIVAKGDSLSKIAVKYNIDITSLLDVNDLSDTNLMVGTKLFIPGATLSTIDLRKAMGELFIFPIQGRLTSPYGYRNDPFTGVRSFHTGIDLAAPTGTLIKAALDGKVAAVGYSSVYGNYVIISHDGGYQTLYGHMSTIIAKKGQYLLQGASVGRVGSTGYSTGSHLHFSVYKSGNTIDPFSVLY